MPTNLLTQIMPLSHLSCSLLNSKTTTSADILSLEVRPCHVYMLVNLSAINIGCKERQCLQTACGSTLHAVDRSSNTWRRGEENQHNNANGSSILNTVTDYLSTGPNLCFRSIPLGVLLRKCALLFTIIYHLNSSHNIVNTIERFNSRIINPLL